MTESHHHWQAVYQDKDTQTVSWFRPHLDTSLRLLRQHGLYANARVIDVGGGASTLVDDLLALGLRQISVLDIAGSALAVARARLGAEAAHVTWIEADIADASLPESAFDYWHDRAVLHFLTSENDLSAYRRQLRSALRPGGIAVIAGFGPNGPERCSGLPVARRSAADIQSVLGADGFSLLAEVDETHETPSGRPQQFCYAVLARRTDD